MPGKAPPAEFLYTLSQEKKPTTNHKGWQLHCSLYGNRMYKCFWHVNYKDRRNQRGHSPGECQQRNERDMQTFSPPIKIHIQLFFILMHHSCLFIIPVSFWIRLLLFICGSHISLLSNDLFHNTEAVNCRNGNAHGWASPKYCLMDTHTCDCDVN